MTSATAPATTRRTLPRLDVIRNPLLRLVIAAAGAFLIYLAIRVSPHHWVAWVALAAPDVPLLAGFQSGLARGQLAPAAVPWYNATHRLIGGIATAGTGLLSGNHTLTGIGLAWVAHVLIDRAAGYTLRTKDGFLRR